MIQIENCIFKVIIHKHYFSVDPKKSSSQSMSTVLEPFEPEEGGFATTEIRQSRRSLARIGNGTLRSQHSRYIASLCSLSFQNTLVIASPRKRTNTLTNMYEQWEQVLDILLRILITIVLGYLKSFHFYFHISKLPHVILRRFNKKCMYCNKLLGSLGVHHDLVPLASHTRRIWREQRDHFLILMRMMMEVAVPQRNHQTWEILQRQGVNLLS